MIEVCTYLGNIWAWGKEALDCIALLQGLIRTHQQSCQTNAHSTLQSIKIYIVFSCNIDGAITHIECSQSEFYSGLQGKTSRKTCVRQMLLQ